MQSKELIQSLIEKTLSNINAAEKLNVLSIDQLNWKHTEDTWSILECLAHLNLYGDFYIPEILKQISKSKYTNQSNFKSGWLGNYFAKSMLPKERLNKMKTFKSMNPIGSTLSKTTIREFIDQQNKIIELLEKAKAVNLTKTKTSISISNLIKLRLGDTFRVVINHNLRHMVQVQNVLNAQVN